MKRTILTGLLALIMVLAACGGDDKKDGDNGGSAAVNPPTNPPTAAGTPVPTTTTRPPAPRSKAVPEVEPYDFEAPASVGMFRRESTQGKATSAQTGGLRATYRSDEATIVLTAYYFDDSAQSEATVKFSLESGSVINLPEKPYYGPTASFGIGLDRHGGYLAAWSHYHWCFLATTNGSLAALNSFLDAFPY